MMSMPWSRRGFLGAAVATTVSLTSVGCLSGSDDDDSPVDLLWGSTDSPEVSIVASPVTAADIVAERSINMTQTEADIANEIRSEGLYRSTSMGPAVRTDVRFVYDDAIVEFEYEPVGSEVGYQVVFELIPGFEADPPTLIRDDRQFVRYDLLPDIDRAQVFERNDWTDGSIEQTVRTGATYSASEAVESVLVPTVDIRGVLWHDEWLIIEQASREELEFTAYEYTLVEADPTPADVGQSIKDEYAFEVGSLDDEQEDIFNEAIESPGGYELVDDEPTVALDELIKQLSDGPPLPPYFDTRPAESNDGPNGTYLVRIDSELYLVQVMVDERADGYTAPG